MTGVLQVPGTEGLQERMIRVLQVLGTVGLGGAESRVMDLYRQMDRRKIQFDFLVTEGTDEHYREEIESLGGRVYHLPAFRMVNIASYRRACREFFASHMAADVDPLRSKSIGSEYAAVHGHMTSTASIYLPIAKDMGVPLTIAHARSAGVDPGLKGIATKLMRKNLYKHCDVMLTCSDEAGDAVFGRGRDYVFMPNAIDAASFAYDKEARRRIRKEYGIDDDTCVIGHVGSFRYAKNHEFVLKVYKELITAAASEDSITGDGPGSIRDGRSGSVPDSGTERGGMRLMLVGDGSLRTEITRMAEDMGISDRVIFTGNQSPVAPYYCAFDVLLFPSRYEGMPGTVVEAQASGLPCVISSAITSQVVITDRVKVLDLDAPISEWTDAIRKIIRGIRTSAAGMGKYRSDVITGDGLPINETMYDVNKQVEYYTKLYTGE